MSSSASGMNSCKCLMNEFSSEKHEWVTLRKEECHIHEQVIHKKKSGMSHSWNAFQVSSRHDKFYRENVSQRYSLRHAVKNKSHMKKWHVTHDSWMSSKWFLKVIVLFSTRDSFMHMTSPFSTCDIREGDKPLFYRKFWSQHTATHCNTLQHTATHCNTLQHTATHCNTRWQASFLLIHDCGMPPVEGTGNSLLETAQEAVTIAATRGHRWAQ